MKNKGGDTLFIHTGLLSKIVKQEDGNMALRIIYFRDLLMKGRKSGVNTGVYFTGKEAYVPSIPDEVKEDGEVVTYQLINGNNTLETKATIARVTDETIIVLPHGTLCHENGLLLIRPDEYIDIHTQKKRRGIGRMMEEFLFAIGGTRNAQFHEAKLRLLKMCGIHDPEREAQQESISFEELVEDAFTYEEITKKHPRKEKRGFLNPVLPSTYRIKKG